ncbi:MAG: hypothetical protein CMH49_09225 [Myxococcales bacterium]|nr:hypothetical protein [Myxococcales bacterium]
MHTRFNKIFKFLLSCIFCLIYVLPTQAKEHQDLNYRVVWAKELTRWTAYCSSRSERDEAIFNGCGSRLQAIKAAQSLFRRIRIDGFVQNGPQFIEAQQVRQWLIALKGKGLSSVERAALIDLAQEGLQVTGDLYWYEVMKEAVLHSIWFSGIACALHESCAVELLAVLKNAKWLQKNKSALPQWSKQDEYIIQRIPALIKVARYLSQTHPQAQFDTDRQTIHATSLWALRAQFASLSLSEEEFTLWWKQEQVSLSNVQTVPEQSQNRFGLNFSRMMGIGQVIIRIQQDPKLRMSQASKDLAKLFHEHARQAMEVYLKHKRNYQAYANPINALGVMALSADIEEQDFAWQVPASRWRYPQFQFKPEHLNQQKIQAAGMFSELAIKDNSTRRGMYFIRPNGQELLETEIDLTRPEFLQVRYTQDMLAVYPFFKQKPKRALLIGLGGGAMVHALHAYDPELDLEVVEIDPVVVRFARTYFGIQALETKAKQTSTKLKVITADGFDYLKSSQGAHQEPAKLYDIVWMDAFLQPTAETDSTGSPLNLKTVEFLKNISKTKLSSHGVLAININHHKGLNRDFESVRAAFPVSSIWQVPETGNYVALGFKSAIQQSAQEILNAADDYTKQQASPFNYRRSMERVLETMRPQIKP